jgi:hypothetical protein
VTAMTIVRASALCFVVLILVQFVASMISGVRGRWVRENKGMSLMGTIWIVFELARRELHVVFDQRILGVLTVALAIFFLGRKSARGQTWSSSEMNMFAVGCVGAAIVLNALVAGAVLMVAGVVAAAIATVMIVREVSGSSAPAR